MHFMKRLARLLLISATLAACGREARSEVAGASPATAAKPADRSPRQAAPASRRPAAPPSASLGLADRGIWSDLDARLQLPAPAAAAERITATLDPEHQVLVVEVDAWPVKAYPLGDGDPWQLGAHTLRLRPGDRAELAGLLRAERLRELPPLPAGSERRRAERLALRGDRDDDGIPDVLDVLLGAKKTVLNADAYTGGYLRIPYPMGDVPRTLGVCTDVIVRALRNAGVDLQRDLQEDLRRARRSYPMVRGGGDPNIDHRRVKTLLPLFLRKWQRHTPALDDAADPLRPGDIVFMDTFPGRSGPDHIGLVSDRLGPSGLPLIINNWTDGTVTAEMELLTFVPVTHRFRLAPPK
jgi:uncharacterized protein YijF (DUF1287 family)